MAFRIAARTILQLGAELISSDGVAFYELIKNAFDARTKNGVRVEVVVRIPYPQYRILKEAAEGLSEVESDNGSRREALRARCAAAITYERAGDVPLSTAIDGARSKESLLEALTSANYIEVRDTGEGMSRRQLEDV